MAPAWCFVLNNNSCNFYGTSWLNKRKNPEKLWKRSVVEKTERALRLEFELIRSMYDIIYWSFSGLSQRALLLDLGLEESNPGGLLKVVDVWCSKRGKNSHFQTTIIHDRETRPTLLHISYRPLEIQRTSLRFLKFSLNHIYQPAHTTHQSISTHNLVSHELEKWYTFDTNSEWRGWAWLNASASESTNQHHSEKLQGSCSWQPSSWSLCSSAFSFFV